MAPHGNQRAPLRARLTSAVAELRPDPARPEGWTLLVDDVPQSYVDLADPGHLEFPYQRQLGTVLRSVPPGGVPERVLHLGGGGLTLARLLHHARPGVAQEVVERDPELLAFVSRLLPFPEAIEVRVGDAREELERAEPGRYDVIVTDVFAGAAMPASVTTAGFCRAARRALRPAGLLATNLMDGPPLAHTRIQAATARSVFAGVALFGEVPVMRGRRAGNVILLAGNVPMIKSGKHEIMLSGSDLGIFTGGARPLLDEPG
jgi:predicted O-methyltransferase YrrM